jgi:hypothetical protein
MVTRNPHAIASCAGLLAGCLAAAVPWAASNPAGDGQPPDRDGAGIEDALPSRPAPATATRRSRPIFVCRDAVPVIFADRPCGQFAEARVLQVHEPGPGQVASVAHVPPVDSVKPRAEPRVAEAGPAPTARDERCRRLRAQRERLDDRMRSGYSAREAAQLWNRWRDVDAQIYAARC